MLKIIIFGLFGFFALLALGIRKKRTEQLEKTLKKLKFYQIELYDSIFEIDEFITKTFLYAKGNNHRFREVFSDSLENPKTHIFDLTYSSTGNQSISYQRLLFIFLLPQKNIPSFVLESINNMERITKNDLIAAEFVPYPIAKNTYLKTNNRGEFDRSAKPLVDKLIKRIENLSIELHQDSLMIYSNKTNYKISNLEDDLRVINNIIRNET